MSALLMKTAEPFLLPGSRTGCLLVHGFTGTPKEMRWLGEYLNQQGYTALGIRLSGHATRPEDMLRNRWPDWLASVEDGYHLLRGLTDRVYVLGLSMGASLSLLFASRFPVSGVVAMAAPHHMPDDPRLPFVRQIAWFKPFFAKGPPDWFDQEAYQEHLSYPADPTRGYGELVGLLAELRLSLGQVRVPALLIYSRDDQTVKPADGHAEAIYAALGSQQKDILWIDKSGHVMTRDARRQQVFQAAAGFIRRVEASAA
jgi:carboxylesterase